MNPEDLIKWRTERDLSQADVARLLGVTRFCISRWESGERHIPAFLHLALKCVKVTKGGVKSKGSESKKERKVKQ